MTYIQISICEFGSWRGLGWRLDRQEWEEPRREGTWYPDWTLFLGPIVVRRLRIAPYREAIA